MNIRTSRTFEALFALEDIRELLSENSPAGIDNFDEGALKEEIDRVRTILDDLERGSGNPGLRKRSQTLSISGAGRRNISIFSQSRPQGRPTPEAGKVLIAHGGE